MSQETTGAPDEGKRGDNGSSFGEILFRGIPASPGIAIATCIVLKNQAQDVISLNLIPAERRDDERLRYHSAVQTCLDELQATYRIAEREIGNVASILESYELILKDWTINEAIERRIVEGFPAENAVLAEYDASRNLFKAAKDPMLRERAMDLDNVKDRLIVALHNRELTHTIARNAIVIAPSIIPQDVILFHEGEILAYVTEVGGIASHSSILARSLGIPAVIGVKNLTAHLNGGCTVIVDGHEGTLIANPGPETLHLYEAKLLESREQHRRLAELRDHVSQTTDNHRITLMANVDSPEEVASAISMGAEGIGLVRTEMLIIRLDRFPDEDEQLEWYSSMAERAYPHPITLRAFDIGTDKFVSGLPHEKNPSLGIRGVRFLLSRPDIFRKQLRAVLRASKHKNVRFMIPMVTRVSEIEDSLALLRECREALREQSEDFDEYMPVGIMIETPAAALLADKLADMVNFFSIGTNDLTQYTLAADRTSDLVSGIYDSFNPAVLKLMKQSIDAARSKNLSVSVCGEFAGHSAATELLIGMGVDVLSVNVPLLPELKSRIIQSSYSRSLQIFEEAMCCERPSEVRKKVAAIKQA